MEEENEKLLCNIKGRWFASQLSRLPQTDTLLVSAGGGITQLLTLSVLPELVIKIEMLSKQRGFCLFSISLNGTLNQNT